MTASTTSQAAGVIDLIHKLGKPGYRLVCDEIGCGYITAKHLSVTGCCDEFNRDHLGRCAAIKGLRRNDVMLIDHTGREIDAWRY